MDDSLRAQRDYASRGLEPLIRRGRLLQEGLARDSLDATTLAATRVWQRDCATAINDLSGGSKAHWLARAFSGAFLVRRTDGGVLVEANVSDLVERVLDVLIQAQTSLAQLDGRSDGAPPAPRRFEFVHDSALRPVLEQAFAESRDAFDRGDFRQALMLSSGAIEAVLTDALQAHGQTTANLSFEARIAAAEGLGLIHGSCARLPPAARAYRDPAGPDGSARPEAPISERDAKVAGQVLRVVLRDLDPGR